MIDTVIFDIDGVIVDSEHHWKDVEFNFIKSLIPSWDEDKHNKIMGLNISDQHKLLKEEFGLKKIESELADFYNKQANEIYGVRVSLLPGFLDLLTDLKNKKFKTAIASSSPASWISIVLTRFSLSRFFDTAFSVEEVKCKGKPYPDIYIHTAKQLGKKPEQCIVIEDSMNGVTSAKSAGMKCIGLRNGFNDNQDLSKADLMIKNFSELSSDRIKNL